MQDFREKQLRFDTGPRELVRLLQSYAKAQTGPFYWKFLHEGRELGLYLIVQKSNKDGFECLVKTILRRRPGSGLLAEECVIEVHPADHPQYNQTRAGQPAFPWPHEPVARLSLVQERAERFRVVNPRKLQQPPAQQLGYALRRSCLIRSV